MCCWIVEQPVGSVDALPFHPRLDWLINHVVYVSSLTWVFSYAFKGHGYMLFQDIYPCRSILNWGHKNESYFRTYGSWPRDNVFKKWNLFCNPIEAHSRGPSYGAWKTWTKPQDTSSNCCLLHHFWDFMSTCLPQVFRTDFWMMHFGADCPKRTTVWSSDGDIIAKLVPASFILSWPNPIWCM